MKRGGSQRETYAPDGTMSPPLIRSVKVDSLLMFMWGLRWRGEWRVWKVEHQLADAADGCAAFNCGARLASITMEDGFGRRLEEGPVLDSHVIVYNGLTCHVARHDTTDTEYGMLLVPRNSRIWCRWSVIVGSFLPESSKEPMAANHVEPLNATPRGTQANHITGPSSSQSHGTLSESSGGAGSPMNRGNDSSPHGMASMPWK
ncbi:AT hook motif DNA-binding family protein [Artemisia annua]|uniref:AT hook motif DNA-binding family protein n=1 Tax=Artemisia annua TaxID=35608 RepID=A0A2U1KFP0_ARTAN|nr:AT hook motif DNA-binding family protein [Artemisia annua]